jgi:hypothetical protein
MVPNGTYHMVRCDITYVPWYHGTTRVSGRTMVHMLTRIVVEIRAADIAVELEPQLQYTVMSSMLTTPTS